MIKIIIQHVLAIAISFAIVYAFCWIFGLA